MGLTYQMELILNITSYHRLSPEIEASKTTKHSLIFGRSEACDWHLPDPEKIISSRHGRIEKEGDSFYLYDTSTNGTFVNFGVSALGQGNKHRLAHSDVITVGDFQIEVELADSQSTTAYTEARPSTDDFALRNSAPAPEIDNFSSSDLFLNESILDESMPAVSMKEENMAQPDNQIPENWDELSHLMNPDVSVSPQNHFDDVAVAEQPVKVEPQKTPEPVKQPVKQAQTHASTASANSDLSEAFLKGLGVKTELQNALNTPELWFEMGQSLNLLLNELMESLRQRALVKNQLRLNQTMFQTKQNNPIKFSADIDDVIQNLFIRNSASFLSSRESIKESFTDTRRHEHALLAGADGVLKGILEQVSPQQITQQVNENSNVLKIIPGQSEAKCWKIYQSLHEELAHDVNAKGAMALSDDFLKAYNDKTQETF